MKFLQIKSKNWSLCLKFKSFKEVFCELEKKKRDLVGNVDLVLTDLSDH